MPDRERNIPIVFGVDAGVSIRHGAFLPHWTREGAAYSVTFRLADSLPAHVVEEWRQEREALVARKQSLGLTQSDVLRLRRLFSDRVERFLDAGHGTCHMRNPDVAEIVQNALLHFEDARYRLWSWSVMPNHVHAVVQPYQGHSLSTILHSWKSFTAQKANNVLNRRGAFWQEESFDHLVRSNEDFDRCVQYAWRNPEKAGLHAWPWRGIRKP